MFESVLTPLWNLLMLNPCVLVKGGSSPRLLPPCVTLYAPLSLTRLSRSRQPLRSIMLMLATFVFVTPESTKLIMWQCLLNGIELGTCVLASL